MRNYYGRNIFGVGQDGDVDSSSGEGLLAFEDGNVLFDANSGAGDKGLGNAARFSPRDDNSSILGDESKHRKGYVLTQNVSVENPKEVAAEDSVFVYPSAVDSLSGVAALAEGTTELDKTCEKYALAEEKTVHVAPEELFLVTPDTITFEDAQMRARETVGATCALHGDEYTSSRNREAEDYADRFLGPSTKDKLLIKDPEMTNEGHHSTVPAESQLLISEAVSENPSVTRVVLGVGYAARLSFEDKGCCESLALDSSGSTVDCALTRNAGHIPKRVDSCTLPEKSMDSLTSAIVSVSGQVEDLILSDLNSTECILHKNEVLLSDNDNREKHQSFKCGQELTSSSLRCQGEDVCDHSEENSVSSRSVVTAGYHISGLTRGISGGSLEEDASCFCGEGLSYLQPFTLDGPVDNSSVPLLTTNSERRVTDDTNMASTSCSGIKDSPQQESNQGMVNSRSVPLIVFRRTNPKRAATLKKDQVDAKPVSSQRTGVRKCKKTSDSGTLFPSINTARRKRSCFYRMERKSHWGKTSSLLTFFKENDKPKESNVDFPLIQNKLLRKTRRCKAIGKRQTDLRDRNLDSQCLIENSNNAVPNVIFAAELFISCRHSEGNQEPLIDMPALGVNFLQRDGEHGDKDIESSLTQDISGDNMLGACPGVSSHVASEPLDKTVASRHSLDPESSPASDIYNPVTDIGATHIEAGTSITQDARVKQSEIVPEMISHGMDVKTVNSSEPTMGCEFLSSLDVQLQTGNKKSQKEKTNVKICHTECNLSENTSIQEKLHNSEINNTAAEPLKYVRQRRIGFKGTNLISSISKNKVTSEGSRISFPDESTILGRADPDYSKKSREEELGLHTWTLPDQTIRNIQIEESRALISGKTKLHNLSRNGKTRVCMDKSSLNGLSSGQRMKSCGQKKFNIQNSEKIRNKKKNQKLEASQEACGNMKVFPGLACDLALLENFELRCNGSERKGSTCGLDCQSMPQRQAWVLCDDCHKWRCIPTALADMIDETHCRWTCKDNTDKAFADCSIPQEKTNSEINAELDISDASCDENVPKKNPARPVKTKVADAQRAPWTHIKSNLYLHRSQKSQTIDETMVCHCKPPSDGNFGCGDQCLNRMLNIECEKGTCPCLEFCANQQFQKRKYAKLKLLPCGKKGFGLQLLEDVSIGRFLIEYVGEVLDFATYEARQKYYATRGQKHFYFMTLNGGEVIDACVKGNLGRFINHSCDPNCRTEKWMVNGEVCIGLFAIRDIKKGEEVTFDYNYVRVFGAAAKKCVCGSSVCRGYIGGDPLNTELIVQDDSEDEYLEAVLGNKENKKLLLNLDMALSDTNDTVEKDTEVSMKELLKDHSPNSETEGHQEIKETLCTSKSIDIGVSNLHVEDAIFRPIYEIQSSENCSKRLAKEQTKVMISHPLTDVEQTDISSEASPAATNIKSDSSVKEISTSDVVGEKIIREKLILAKSSRPTHLTKKSKPRVRAVLLQNAKSSQSGSISQFQRVEKELNDLLDDSGGISKRKDATRGYLKLLFVTAAEGDNVGGASQSIRDLSLILDALLKTKSRTVLMDIINKNGLQMLHNIMKQNRSRFSRIPIIRKLLKVLEFLALKGILIPEHINKGPPCSGMESFTESMLSLTRHNDIQVHQIARSFRDKWIPRMIKRVEPSDREEKQFDSQRFNSSWFHSSSLNRHLGPGVRNSDAIVCVSEPMEQPTSSGSLAKPVEIFAHSSQVVYFSLPLTNDNSIATRTRKRKSRWDQPSDCKAPNHQNLSSSQEQETGSVKTAFSDLQLRTEPKEMKLDIERHVQEKFCSDGVAVMKNLTCQNSGDDIPPGFGSPEEDHHMTSETQVLRGEVVVGYLQDRYHSHLSVSYGIPMSLVQKLGTPGSVTKTDGHQCWTVAPCMPFHPFPPLPPYPRGQPNPSKHTIDPCTSSIVIQTSSKTQSNTLSNLSSCITDRSVPSVSVRRPADNLGTWPRNLQSTERMCWTSSGCERRLFRLDRGNNQKFRRWGYPQPQEGSTCGPRGSLRYRDAGISLRDERQHWPPWSGEDNVFSKGQKDRD